MTKNHLSPLSLSRRAFIRLIAASSGAALASPMAMSAALNEADESAPRLVRYPEKSELILLTDRPPLLETPLHYFRQDLTPNEAFFVRWHLSGIPTTVDLRTFRLQIGGHVERPLSLSVAALRQQFEPFSLIQRLKHPKNEFMFNTLILIMSLLLGIFILTWRRRPALRQEIEKPKYRFLTQERRFDAAMSRSREPRTRIVQDSTTKPPSKLNHG